MEGALTYYRDVLTRLEAPFEIRHDDTQGKHIVAIKDIPCGTSILEESPLVCWPSRLAWAEEEVCGHCLRKPPKRPKPRVCDNCCVESFCHRTCVSAIHDSCLCPVLKALRSHKLYDIDGATDEVNLETLARIVAHITVRLVLTAEKHQVTLEQAAPTVMAPWERFMTVPDEAEFALNIPLAEVFTALRGIMAPSVTQTLGEEFANELLSDAFLRGLLGRVVLNAQACTNGAAVYVIQSNFNHSCAPNCQVDFEETSDIAVKTCKDVKIGEELTISYIPDGLQYMERKSRLETSHLFTCACELCEMEKKTMMTV